MARPEGKVEDYLAEQVELHGGTCEKFVSPNRKNVPDRLVCWPNSINHPFPLVDFVETKAPGKGANDGQKRDHDRRRAMGYEVLVLNTRELVDGYIRLRRAYWTELIG